MDLAARAENATDPPSPSVEKPARRPKGRPPNPEPRVVFGTRLKAATIDEVEALKVGLRMRMQGEAIERAVAFYRAHVIAKTRVRLELGQETDDKTVLLAAHRADYAAADGPLDDLRIEVRPTRTEADRRE